MKQYNNSFFYISFSLVLLLFALFAFGCSGGSYADYDDYDDDLSPVSGYSGNESTDDAARIRSLQEQLSRARLENQRLNNQLSELERTGSKRLSTVSESISLEYNNALRLFNEKKYGESMAKFQKIYSTHPSIVLAPNCVYWVGECYYGMRDFRQAALAFEQVLSEFPGSVKDDDALLMLGHSYFRLNNRTKAQEAYMKLQRIHPESPYVKNIPAAFRS